MKSQDEKSQLIEYLFDEMTAEERTNFEKRLHDDNELQEEMTGLAEVREFLQLAENSAQSVDAGRQTITRSSPIRLITRIAGIAAGVLLAFLAGHWFSQIQQMQPEEIRQIVQDQVESSNAALLAGIHDIERQVEARFEDSEARHVSMIQGLRQPAGQGDWKNYTDDRLEELVSNLQIIQSQYSDQLEGTINQLINYFEESRRRDLQFLTSEIGNLQERIEYTTLDLRSQLYQQTTN